MLGKFQLGSKKSVKRQRRTAILPLPFFHKHRDLILCHVLRFEVLHGDDRSAMERMWVGEHAHVCDI